MGEEKKVKEEEMRRVVRGAEYSGKDERREQTQPDKRKGGLWDGGGLPSNKAAALVKQQR